MPAKTILITGASDGIGAAAAPAPARWPHSRHRRPFPEKTRAIALEVGAEPFIADFTRSDGI